MRQKEKGRHWKDNRTLGNRAFFHYKETGMRSETGAMQIASFLTIESLRPEDNGFYRCRVDFKEAPTKNTKINLKLIGRPKLLLPFLICTLWRFISNSRSKKAQNLRVHKSGLGSNFVKLKKKFLDWWGLGFFFQKFYHFTIKKLYMNL